MEFSKKKYLASIHLVIILILVSFFIVSCSKDAHKEEVIKIGAILPLTGQLSFIGQEEKNGFDMAFNNFNERTRKKFEIIYNDSKGLPKEGVSSFNKLVSVNDANIIITSISAVTNSILPLADNNNIVMFPITIQPEVTKNKNNVFRIWPNSLDEWKLLINYIKETDYKRFGLYYSAGDFGLMAKEYFKKELPSIGRKLIYSEMVEVGQTNVASLVVKHKYDDIDAAIIICYPADAGNIVKKMRQNKIDVPLLSYLTFTFDFLRKMVAEEAEGTIFTCPSYSLHKSKYKKGENFTKEYLELYDKEPNWNAAFSYDLMTFIIDGLKDYKGPLNKKSLIKEIEKKKVLEGVTGSIHMTSDHDSKVSLELAILKDGQIIPLSQ